MNLILTDYLGNEKARIEEIEFLTDKQLAKQVVGLVERVQYEIIQKTMDELKEQGK